MTQCLLFGACKEGTKIRVDNHTVLIFCDAQYKNTICLNQVTGAAVFDKNNLPSFFVEFINPQ